MTNQSRIMLLSTIAGIALFFNLQSCIPERSLANRLKSYTVAANTLACMSDKKLKELFTTAAKLSSSYGEAGSLNIDGVPVFFKKIPLTDLERKPANRRSTANLFNLPLFYQYGVGSAGFSAWRELAANIITSNWALTGECENFPLLYHWRVLAGSINKSKNFNKQELDKYVKYWDNSSAVRARTKALHESSAYIVLFLESIPETVDGYLDKKIKENPDAMDEAVSMIEKNLESTTSFMAAHGMYHFDAHFHNIMTDGCRLYFADFGLAASSSFDLSPAEITFFDQHKLYDRFYMRSSLASEIAHRLIPSHDGAIKLLQEYIDGKQEITFSPIVTSILKRYAQYAVVGNTFFTQLRKVSKSTPYPAEEIERLCDPATDKTKDSVFLQEEPHETKTKASQS